MWCSTSMKSLLKTAQAASAFAYELMEGASYESIILTVTGEHDGKIVNQSSQIYLRGVLVDGALGYWLKRERPSATVPGTAVSALLPAADPTPARNNFQTTLHAVVNGHL